MASQTQMTKGQMETESLIIESLLDSINAMFAASDCTEDQIVLVEMASARAKRLNQALCQFSPK